MSDNILRISSTSLTPDILIDYDDKFVSIIGKSVPDDAYDFYLDIIQKIKNIKDLIIEIYFEYLNSASLRFLTFALNYELNIDKVIWKYEKNDIDIEEKGKLIKDIMNKEHPDIDFQVVEVS
jgi:hypothetical protein